MCQRKCQVHPLLLILVDKSGQKSKRMKHSEPAVPHFFKHLSRKPIHRQSTREGSTDKNAEWIVKWRGTHSCSLLIRIYASNPSESTAGHPTIEQNNFNISKHKDYARTDKSLRKKQERKPGGRLGGGRRPRKQRREAYCITPRTASSNGDKLSKKLRFILRWGSFRCVRCIVSQFQLSGNSIDSYVILFITSPMYEEPTALQRLEVQPS